jgi:hypothetical protein
MNFCYVHNIFQYRFINIVQSHNINQMHVFMYYNRAHNLETINHFDMHHSTIQV